ncbi:MAG: bifunctional nicotinamidase/pyrazinamidase [Spirochaetia bacterium]
MMKDIALIVVDVQNDFCEGGALAVPGSNAIIPVINRLISEFGTAVATRDWHPEGHISFASRHPGKEPQDTVNVDGLKQVLWPDHCVPGTEGAEFHPELDLRKINLILHKGNKKDLDSYSAFFENDQKTSTGLEFYLKGLGIKEVYICGLAADVCVYYTAQDALKTGFKTTVISDATKGVVNPPESTQKVFDDIAGKGGIITDSEDILS